MSPSDPQRPQDPASCICPGGAENHTRCQAANCPCPYIRPKDRPAPPLSTPATTDPETCGECAHYTGTCGLNEARGFAPPPLPPTYPACLGGFARRAPAPVEAAPRASSPSAAPACSGLSARWCPVHGDCCCAKNDVGEPTLDDARCPLHAPGSAHADAPAPPVPATTAPRCKTCGDAGYVMAYDQIEPGISVPAGEPCPDCDGPPAPAPTAPATTAPETETARAPKKRGPLCDDKRCRNLGPCACDDDRASSPSAPSDDRRRVVWVAEKIGSDPPLYHVGPYREGSPFTPSIHEAFDFGCRAECERWVQTYESGYCVAREHVIMGAAPAPRDEGDEALVDVLMASVELDGFHGDEEDEPAACRAALLARLAELRRVCESSALVINDASDRLAAAERRGDEAREALALVINSYDESGHKFIGSAELRVARAVLAPTATTKEDHHG